MADRMRVTSLMGGTGKRGKATAEYTTPPAASPRYRRGYLYAATTCPAARAYGAQARPKAVTCTSTLRGVSSTSVCSSPSWRHFSYSAATLPRHSASNSTAFRDGLGPPPATALAAAPTSLNGLSSTQPRTELPASALPGENDGIGRFRALNFGRYFSRSAS